MVKNSDNTPGTLTVVLTSETPFVYKDNEGYTVVVGNVENKNELTPVTNVQIRVNFYDDTGSEPLETNQGLTLEVIPELGISPYMVKSSTPNPNITRFSFLKDFYHLLLNQNK